MKVESDFGKVNMPDFMIVGAGKSGTSSLHHYLNEHPDVYMPWHKETWFFHLKDNPNKSILKIAPYLPTNFLTYLGLYIEAKENQICGEATPSYLYYYESTIKNIKRYHPEWRKLKIIIILREPISKVISHYKFVHTKNLDPDKLNLEDALSKEEQRKQENNVLPDLFYIDNTLYYKQVKAYLDTFPNTKIFLYDELKKNPEELISNLYDFVGVDSTFKPLSLGKKFNPSNKKLIPKNKFSKYLANYMNRFSYLIPPILKNKIDKILYKEEIINSKTINFLKNAFKKDLINLQKIIDKDISHWISKYE